ncbi:MAG TPA: SdrD B-like domain-containing protein [Woeseiaceae bacterium]|nr:SdrD B-like domain-containing protein [Woeseiaceae bacterium]
MQSHLSACFGVAHRIIVRLPAILALVASLAVVPAGNVLAAEITFVSVVGSWRDPVDSVPGAQPGDPVITNGNPISSISWGTTTGSQSGYDFIATLPPPFDLPGPIPFFSLGTFQHRNFEVGEPSLVSAELDVVLVLAVDGVPTGPLNFSFTLNHEETPNNLDPCPYPTPPGEGCTDRVTIVASADPTTFNVDGVDYTLEMSFLDNGSPVDEFITREGDTVNSSGLVGEFTLPPGLSVTKSGPATMRLGEWGNFVIAVQNASESDAYNTTLVDRLPDGPTGGMCDATPEIQSAQVFEADGVTPVAGKGPLVSGADYTLTYNNAACELTFITQTDASVIGVNERLMIAYRTLLDADSQDGVTLTNVAGATQWFNQDASTEYRRTITDGTIGIGDHEDAHSVTVDLPALQFEKTIVNVTTGEDPGTVASPGDTLRYTLRIENAGTLPLDGFDIVDELDNLNATPMFQAGTLTVTLLPPGADDSNTDANGGAAGTGLLDVRNLSIGGLGEEIFIEFEVQLAPVIANDSIVLNQSQASSLGYTVAVSDDPYVNGAADPNVAGDEDPTEILIQSAPEFVVEKISSYLDGNPNILLAGERLRYTITVRNVGTDNATGVYIVDQVPAYTTYIAGSTTLNGNIVPDTTGSPLIDGIDVNAPDDTTPGVLNAGVADNTATITFDVLVDADAVDGTIISNQAFVSAVDFNIADQPSDDPRTELPDDPTRDIVGNYPLLFATKTAALQIDNSSPGIVDPDDVLRYTITIYNNGTVPATLVELFDDVPAYTTYEADSTTLNGAPIGVPDNGVFPLASRIDVSSADLPAPRPGEGVLSPGESAVIQFDLRVDAATPRGTLIVNQATVYSNEVANLLTDGDGNPATGPEPTVVVVGDVQTLTIVKEVSVVDGGPAIAGATLEYVVTVRNVGALPALYVTLRDDLDETNPGYLMYVDQSATLNGLANGVSVVGPVITVDYFNDYGPLNPGESIVLRFRTVINPALVEGTTLVNTARVYWDDPLQQAEAFVMIDVGAMPDAGMLSGEVWHDADHDNTPGGLERGLESWLVELLLDDQLVRSMVTDIDGYYRFNNVAPNYAAGQTYSLRFSAPGAVSTTALMGQTDSDFTDGQQRIDEIDVQEGSNLLALNMPVDPNGVIYDSVARTPVGGAVVTMLDPRNGLALPSACFDDPNHQGQVTVPNGYYKFDINFSDPACPSGLNYLLQVVAPDTTFVPGVSELIPPSSDETTLPFDVPLCPGSGTDAVPGTPQTCESQPSEFQPPTSVTARSPETDYHLFLRLDSSQSPGSSQLFNNHVPLDPRLGGAVAITKTTPMLNVTRGQLIPYVITISNTFGIALQDVDVVDRFPAGFRYIEGSARFDGQPLEPTVVGRELTWSDFTLDIDGRHTIKLLLAAGAGLTEGEFVNRAQAMNSILGSAISEEASATVRIIPDPTFDCTDVTGKVFNDANRDGIQDGGEEGLAGVRLVTATGLVASTDAYGRYHITCAIVPNESRGSNFVLKLDDRTLPSGFRPSTRPVQVQRATRGKALRMNFGASIHRVVGLDIADAVFEPGEVEMRQQWVPRISTLILELQTAPATLRLSYVADVESEALVEQRLESLKSRIATEWEEHGCCYELVIEPEIHWRLGKPAKQPRGVEQ